MNKTGPTQPRDPENARDEDAIAFARGIFDLARNGGSTLLAPLLEAGVPVDMRTSEGDTLLMLAARQGHKTTTELLIARGADPDQQNHQQRTPLMEAAIADHGELVSTLLSAGANAGLADGDGQTALALARSAGADAALAHLEAVR